ncbi:MAG: leucine-rich repeat domain-containing protein [Clostridia bacterium]|nr:leucine-rich repeat domain-containing protein [Clostridia bacterium]
MENYEVISKGAYTRPQTGNFVEVSSYIFVRSEGRKYLLLKLKNCRSVAVEGIDLKITLLDAGGRMLKNISLSSDRGGAAESSFAFSEKIEVDEACCDFIAKAESAVFGGLVYRNGKNGVVEEGAAESGQPVDLDGIKTAMRGKTRVVSQRRLGVPVLVSILACVLLACVALATYFQLKDFIGGATGFTYSGVKYEFEDGDKSAGSNIIVTGYRGSKPNVLIPEKIDGHTVIAISGGAFENNSKIKRLKIEGGVKIGGNAFAGCTKLASVSMDKTTEVGERAFAECAALKSLEITGEGEISLGAGAFRDCKSLKTVKIEKTVIYPEDAAIFRGDLAVTDLYLQNYDGENCGTIAGLFGTNDAATSSLKNLTIGYLGKICDDFCRSFMNLESVEIVYIHGDEYSIGNNAFRGTALTTLRIPQEGLISVGNFAFERTNIPYFNADGVESIGDSAFANCTQITGFTVPETLKMLGQSAFENCTSLVGVTFEGEEKILVYIGDYAFANCENLTEIQIPDSVEYFGYRALAGCVSLTSLTAPYFGYNADRSDTIAYNCGSENNLERVTLTRAQSLAAYAFANCTALKEVNLNEGIGGIGNRAFFGCTGLKKIVIPSTVRAAGYDIFENCYRLFEIYNLSRTEIPCDYSIAIFDSLGRAIPKALTEGYIIALTDGSFAQPAGWYLIDYPEDKVLDLPSFDYLSDFEGYTVIDYLFYREDITSVTIPETVNSIGAFAFCECENLAEVSISRSSPVSEIKAMTFKGCKALTTFRIPDGVTRIGNSAFGGCTSLGFIGFNENLTSTDDYAFSGCTSLTDAVIPNRRALSLGMRTFSGCTALAYVDIRGGVTSIDRGAFEDCTSLKTVSIPSADGGIGESAFNGCTALSEIVIPSGVTGINAGAFAYCKSLRKITLPPSLGGIGDSAFFGCDRLRAVVNYSSLQITDDMYDNGGIGYSAVFVVSDVWAAEKLNFTEINGVTFLQLGSDWVAVWCGEGVTSLNLGEISYGGNRYSYRIAKRAFKENTEITAANLNVVTEIGEEAFSGCTALKNLSLGKNLTEIGEGAFARCYDLASVNLQDTQLSYLGEGAFYNCVALKYLSLPRTLTAIPAQAFYYCSAVADAVIPSSVITIGDQAFYGCDSLLQVHNLSRLNITAGSPANGYCGFYALCVFDNEKDKINFAEADGFKFAEYGGSWNLYGSENTELYKILPESFTFEKTKVSSYKIRKNALTDYGYYVIPTSVTEIENGAIGASRAIYYCGTQAQWMAIRPSNLSLYTDVYFYADCIHEDSGSIWTYGKDGKPTTMQTELVWTTTKNPTCTQDGERSGKCPTCGITRTEKDGKLYHGYNTNGKCPTCKTQGEFVKSVGESDGYSVSASGFRAQNGAFISTNSYASLTVTADRKMQVRLKCYTSNYYSYITVSSGGEVIDEAGRGGKEIAVELEAGQSLTLNYQSSGTATIDYILIFEL